MRKTKSKNGITLISLVITIIVLLILATVAISMAVDSNGLFKRAEYATEIWSNSVGKESTAVENAMLIMNQIGGESTNGGETEQPPKKEDEQPSTGSHTLSSEIVKKGEKAILTVTGEDNVGVKQIKKPDGTMQTGDTATYEIETTGEYKFEIEDEEGNITPYIAKVRIAVIPEGYVASNIESERTIENGVVIYEGEGEVNDGNHTTAMENRNQYVWIPIDNIDSMVLCQKCGAKGTLTLKDNKLQCTEHGDETSLGGKNYHNTSTRTFDKDFSGQYYGSTYLEPTSNGRGGEVTKQADFDDMAKSVAKYKGFYISRYEIQQDGDKIGSKKNKPVMNAAGNKWEGLHNKIENGGTPSSTIAQMIWGCQYDQIMLFVDEKIDGQGETFNVKTKNTKRSRTSRRKQWK